MPSISHCIFQSLLWSLVIVGIVWSLKMVFFDRRGEYLNQKEESN